MTKRLIALSAAALVACPSIVWAQSAPAGSGAPGGLTAGYGGARYTTARQASGSTRDANGNRLIVDGLIQTGASSYASSSGGVSSSVTGVGSNNRGGTTLGGSTAIGNQLNVVVQGNHNTVIVNSTQTNTGNVTAGTSVNGTQRPR